MDEIRVLIVDDERLARERIRGFLARCAPDARVEEAGDGVEALETIASFAPSIVFLDVEMPGLSGLEVLAQVSDRRAQIVFQTAFDQFAIRAFDENACDYLLKPFDEDRFQKAWSRAIERLGKSTDYLEGLEKAVAKTESLLKQIAIRKGARIHLLPLEEILAFVSRDHCTLVVTHDGREWICELSLTHLESRLPEKAFKRLHRNQISRLDAIRSVRGGDNMEVELKNGLRLPVSRANRAFVKALIRP